MTWTPPEPRKPRVFDPKPRQAIALPKGAFGPPPADKPPAERLDSPSPEK